MTTQDVIENVYPWYFDPNTFPEWESKENTEVGDVGG